MTFVSDNTTLAENTSFAGKIARRAALAAVFVLAVGVASGEAQQPTAAQTSAVRANCRSDFMANCSGVQPGGRDALECLKRNLGKLSDRCQATVISQFHRQRLHRPASCHPPVAIPQLPSCLRHPRCPLGIATHAAAAAHPHHGNLSARCREIVLRPAADRPRHTRLPRGQGREPVANLLRDAGAGQPAAADPAI